MYRPASMELIVWRETPTASPSWACDSPRDSRSSRTRIRTWKGCLTSGSTSILQWVVGVAVKPLRVVQRDARISYPSGDVR